MSAETLLEQAATLIGDRAGEQTTPEPGRMDLTIAPEKLAESVRDLSAAHWGYLAAISGLDHGPEDGRMEVLYHFCRKAAVLTLRVPVPRENPVVPSICKWIPAASFFERELMEMFGVVCEGTPDPRRLFIADDWPQGVYPLRKDYVVPAPSEGREGGKGVRS